MEFLLILGIPIIILTGLTVLFIKDGIPSWVENLELNSSTICNLGIITITSTTIIVYFSRN